MFFWWCCPVAFMAAWGFEVFHFFVANLQIFTVDVCLLALHSFAGTEGCSVCVCLLRFGYAQFYIFVFFFKKCYSVLLSVSLAELPSFPTARIEVLLAWLRGFSCFVSNHRQGTIYLPSSVSGSSGFFQRVCFCQRRRSDCPMWCSFYSQLRWWISWKQDKMIRNLFL